MGKITKKQLPIWQRQAHCNTTENGYQYPSHWVWGKRLPNLPFPFLPHSGFWWCRFYRCRFYLLPSLIYRFRFYLLPPMRRLECRYMAVTGNLQTMNCLIDPQRTVVSASRATEYQVRYHLHSAYSAPDSRACVEIDSSLCIDWLIDLWFYGNG